MNNFNGVLPFVDDTKVKIRDNINELFTKRLDYTVLGDSTLIFIIPAASTVFLGGDTDMPINAESLSLSSKKNKVIITNDHLYDYLERLGFLQRFPVRYSLTFK